MLLYVVVYCDRHNDPEVEVYSTPGKAVDAAIAWELEGDDVRVFQRTLDVPVTT